MNLLPKDILIKLIGDIRENLKDEKIEKKLSKIPEKKKYYDIANFANDNTEFNFYVCHYKDCQEITFFESVKIGENTFKDVCKKCDANYCRKHVELCFKDDCCISCPPTQLEEDCNLNIYSKGELIKMIPKIEESLNEKYEEGIFLYKRYKKYDEILYVFHNNHNFNINTCDYCDAFDINSTYYNKSKIIYSVCEEMSLCEDCLKNYEDCLENYEDCLENYEDRLENYEDRLENYEDCLENYEDCLENYEEINESV
jgi:hypothetical protein